MISSPEYFSKEKLAYEKAQRKCAICVRILNWCLKLLEPELPGVAQSLALRTVNRINRNDQLKYDFEAKILIFTPKPWPFD